jgi:hypothetical protein
MVLQNYVILQNDVPARLHFTDHRIEPRTITSPDTLQPAIKNTLVLDVDRLNGLPVHAILSTMAEKLASQFTPYLEKKLYTSYEFVITQRGDGYLRKWTVQAIPATL